jgi:hypothetical protein
MRPKEVAVATTRKAMIASAIRSAAKAMEEENLKVVTIGMMRNDLDKFTIWAEPGSAGAGVRLTPEITIPSKIPFLSYWGLLMRAWFKRVVRPMLERQGFTVIYESDRHNRNNLPYYVTVCR